MDEDKRKTLVLGIFLGLAAVIAVLYFFWGYLNRGTIRITAQAPFTVEIFEGEKHFCEASPCEIKDKIGRKQLILQKEGYKSKLEEVNVKLWRTIDLEIEFEVIPYLIKVDAIPKPDKKFIYEIILDEENHMYKLVNSKDPEKRAIVYFQKKIKKPIIFGSKNSALIIDKIARTPTAYKIDITNKTREKIADFNFADIQEGEWSNNYNFVFSKQDSEYLYLLNPKNSVKQTTLNKNYSKYAWTYTGSLLFATKQQTTTNAFAGKYGNDYIDILTIAAESASISQSASTFGEYHPDENSYTLIKAFPEITALPQSLIPASNGQIIYLQTGEEKYKLMLK